MMKAILLYRPKSEYARIVEEYEHEFGRVTAKSIELKDIDTIEGTRLAELYDVMAFPALLVVGNDGQLLRAWIGETLPLMNEVAAYLHEQ